MLATATGITVRSMETLLTTVIDIALLGRMFVLAGLN
jgi:hypothetical protein